MEQTPRAFFQTTFESIGRVCARGGLELQGKWRTRACVPHTPYMRAMACSPTGREQVAADSGVAGRLKKNARNINSGNFSGSLYLKADGTNAASVFQTAFEPTGSVCTARHARGGLGLQGKWRMCAYRTHPTYGLRLACCNQ